MCGNSKLLIKQHLLRKAVYECRLKTKVKKKKEKRNNAVEKNLILLKNMQEK